MKGKHLYYKCCKPLVMIALTDQVIMMGAFITTE